jgi:hypothetical protein
MEREQGRGSFLLNAEVAPALGGVFLEPPSAAQP